MSVRNSKKLYCGSASLALLASGLCLLAAPALAQQVAANGAGEIETVVITGTAFNPDTAPAKSSLETTEPQTIISKSYIQDSVAATGTYTTILAIAPSMTGTDLNGPGLSDGGVKNTLRGLPDGSFGINFDGIPFGDTNGPTHHSESYFPASVIGSIDVDRGPGNAGNMGPSTYGGSINIFSEVLSPDRHLRVEGTGGTWNTSMGNLNVQTGDFDVLGLNNRALVNFQDTNTGGYLTLNSSAAQNYLIKTQTDIAPGWTLTALADYNGLFQQLEDNAGTTAAQLVAYGKNFALQNTNPNAGTYAAYNHVHKKTDMDYLRLQGDLGNGIKIDNTAYTYAYVNKTLSTTSIMQTAADIARGITEGNGSIVHGVAFPNDVPGYTKQNAYRNWGDIFRVSDDFDYDWLTGEVRTGVWWEHSSSQRARSDYDATQCNASSAGCDPWHTQFYADSRLLASHGSSNTAIPNNANYYEYYEHSGWDQYQPFVELELHPFTPDLTITPGFKYVWWNHYVNAPLEQKTKPVVAADQQFTTTQDLPFATVNYKIEPSWSIYFQYAKGIYIPDISAFEQKVPTGVFPKAETTTNYQFGTVYYADNWTFDGDIYYIGVNNNYVSGNCTLTGAFAGPLGETCFVNTGSATYKGIEGEGTYAFDGVLQGLAVFLNGSLNSSKSDGFWIKQAPMWTSASGLFYKRDEWSLSVIDKLVGQQYSDNTNTTFYKLGAYNDMDFKGSYSFSNYEFSIGIFNVLNSRSLAAVTINDATTTAGNVAGMPAATGVNDYADRQNSLDQYSYQPSRSVQFTVKAQF
ncbi:MAG TPA: TonB-dependent receptor [Rhizomicrobium sp.]|jgi:iron complex outermembrane receptor protein|nr:TonB-dependent receptor [Rhizomicrobium sp.]